MRPRRSSLRLPLPLLFLMVLIFSFLALSRSGVRTTTAASSSSEPESDIIVVASSHKQEGEDERRLGISTSLTPNLEEDQELPRRQPQQQEEKEDEEEESSTAATAAATVAAPVDNIKEAGSVIAAAIDIVLPSIKDIFASVEPIVDNSDLSSSSAAAVLVVSELRRTLLGKTDTFQGWSESKKGMRAYLAKASLILATSQEEFETARKVNREAAVSHLGAAKICLDGDRSVQYSCLSDFLGKACGSNLKAVLSSLIPEQYAMDSPQSCAAFFRVLVSKGNRDGRTQWFIRSSQKPDPRLPPVRKPNDTIAKQFLPEDYRGLTKLPAYSILDVASLGERYQPCSQRKRKTNEIIVKRVQNLAKLDGNAFSVRTYLMLIVVPFRNEQLFIAYSHHGFLRRTPSEDEKQDLLSNQKRKRRKGKIFFNPEEPRAENDTLTKIHLVSDLALADTFLERLPENRRDLPQGFFSTTFRDNVKRATILLARAMHSQMPSKSGGGLLFQIFSMDWLVTRDLEVLFLDSNGAPTSPNLKGIPTARSMWSDCLKLVLANKIQADKRREKRTSEKYEIPAGLGGWTLQFSSSPNPEQEEEQPFSCEVPIAKLKPLAIEFDTETYPVPVCDPKARLVPFGSLASCSKLQWDDMSSLDRPSGPFLSRGSNFIGDKCAASKIFSPYPNPNLMLQGDSPGSNKGAGQSRCSGPVSLTEAKQFCEGVGARLCTFRELHQLQLTMYTGCDSDDKRVWTMTKCGPFSYITSGGKRSASIRPRCMHADSTFPPVVARCCADNSPPRCVPASSLFEKLPPESSLPCEEPNKRRMGSDLSCAELKFPVSEKIRSRDGFKVCGTDRIDSKCSGLVNFDDARGMCESRGARLCTSEEILGGVAETTRRPLCQPELGYLWSSTPCQRVNASDISLEEREVAEGRIVVLPLHKRLQIDPNSTIPLDEPEVKCLPRVFSSTGLVSCCADRFGQYCGTPPQEDLNEDPSSEDSQDSDTN